MVKIGQGNVTSGSDCQGVLRVVESVADVLRLMKGATSHVAIVAREFDLACIMGVQFELQGELDGCVVRMNAEGEIFMES